MKIPLFDIDGTLLETKDPVHLNSFNHAFETVYGIKATIYDAGKPEGRINKQIFFEIMKYHGLNEKDILEKIDLALKAQADYIDDHKAELNPIVLPGAIDLLTKLREMNFPIGVLTGNTQRVAKIRLEIAGIWNFLNFGAYGDEAMKRVDLVEVARLKAENFLLRKVNQKDLVIIGDTPRDIQCAKEAGITVISVPTGIHSKKELEEEKPDLLIQSLQEKDLIINFLST